MSRRVYERKYAVLCRQRGSHCEYWYGIIDGPFVAVGYDEDAYVGDGIGVGINGNKEPFVDIPEGVRSTEYLCNFLSSWLSAHHSSSDATDLIPWWACVAFVVLTCGGNC